MNDELRTSIRPGRLDRFLDGLETSINKLPNPFVLFFYLSLALIVLSFVLNKTGLSLSFMTADPKTKEEVLRVISVNNLLNREYLTELLVGFPKLFISFQPLALSLVVMMCISVADKTGLLSAVVRSALLKASPVVLVAVVSFLAVNGNLFSDAAMFVLTPLAAAIFFELGFNPWLGIILVFVGATAGFSASVIITQTDIQLAGITELSLAHLGIQAPVNPLMNWYFIAASTFLITGTMIFVTRCVMKRKLPLRRDHLEIEGEHDAEELKKQRLSEREKSALRRTGFFALIYVLIIAALVIPSNGLLRAADGSILPKSPFIDGLVMLLALFFLLSGVLYGKASGSMKSIQELPDMMKEGIASLSGFIVVIAVACVFIKLFNDSRIGELIGGSGGLLLKHFQISPLPALLGFALVTAAANLFIISGAIKWLIFAPIFLPMLVSFNLSPAMIQMVFRVGDGPFNALCPVNPLLFLIIGLLDKWKPKGSGTVGIGTPIVLAVPYAFCIFLALLLQLALWALLDLPLGPGAAVRL